MVNVVCVSGRG